MQLRIGHASKNEIKRFLEESGMYNILRLKGTHEVIENVIANCTASNETGKVANIKCFVTPRSKFFFDLVAKDLAEKTDPNTNQLSLL